MILALKILAMWTAVSVAFALVIAPMLSRRFAGQHTEPTGFEEPEARRLA